MSRLSTVSTVSSLLLLAVSAFAADQPAAEAVKAKPYPFDTCIISGEKLGGMGEAIVVIKDGQEVKFCCKGCIKDFNKDPAKYLAKIAEAGKTDAKAEKPADAVHQH